MRIITSKTIVAATLSALVILSGCKKADENPVEPEVTFELLQNSITAPAQGGDITVRYTAENLSDGMEPTAEYDAGWILSYDASVQGEISFNIAENTDTLERSCDVIITLEDIPQTLTLLQEAAEAEDPEDPEDPDGPEEIFTITIDDIGEASVTVSVEPRDDAATYFIMAVEKTEYDGWGSDEAAFEAITSVFIETAQLWGIHPGRIPARDGCHLDRYGHQND